MKILLDENMDVRLKNSFQDQHEVYTMRDMEWLGKKNGELLGLMVFHNFDILVTSDRNLQYQQNINKFPISIAILKTLSNTYNALEPLIPILL